LRTDPSAHAAIAVMQKHWRSPLPGVPKYVQLREALIEAIASGCWEPGAKLPAELELARKTPFSLGTVQRALRELAEDGVLVRQQGSGTYIAGHRKAMHAPWHCRFLADDGVSLLPVYPKVIRRARVTRAGPWSTYLAQPGADIVRIDRRISVNDEFQVLSCFHFDASRFRTLWTRPLAELDGMNFKVILAREFGLPITHVAQTLLVQRFDAETCRLIEVEPRTTGVVLRVVASAGRARPVYYQELSIPPSSRSLQVADSHEARALHFPESS
jgi:GntR family transcriptional regulator